MITASISAPLSTGVSYVLQPKILEIILSAFAGGFFAGFFSNLYESKRRINDKRYDKYFDHRNTIVQIEHELIPARINMSRNMESLRNAVQETDENKIQLILRFYELSLSTGLSLKLVNIDLINLYSEVFTEFKSITSDFQYVGGMVNMIIEDLKTPEKPVRSGLLDSYVTAIKYLYDACKDADAKSLDLLVNCQIALRVKNKSALKKYLKSGDQIPYLINKKEIKEQKSKLIKQETRKPRKGESRPQFFSPFMNLRRQ